MENTTQAKRNYPTQKLTPFKSRKFQCNNEGIARRINIPRSQSLKEYCYHTRERLYDQGPGDT